MPTACLRVAVRKFVDFENAFAEQIENHQAILARILLAESPGERLRNVKHHAGFQRAEPIGSIVLVHAAELRVQVLRGTGDAGVD